MKKLALTLSLLIAASVATGAQAMIAHKVDASQYSGSQLHQMVQQRGSLILQTAPGIFDRYVANGSHCARHEEPRAAWVPSADSNGSFVGYRCVTDTDEG